MSIHTIGQLCIWGVTFLLIGAVIGSYIVMKYDGAMCLRALHWKKDIESRQHSLEEYGRSIDKLEDEIRSLSKQYSDVEYNLDLIIRARGAATLDFKNLVCQIEAGRTLVNDIIPKD